VKKPSPSLIVSSAALLVALGGTSYAAATINGKDLRNNTVTAEKIKNKTLTSKDVKNGSIKAKSLADGVIPAVPAAARWALVNAAGQIEAQSGGFAVVTAYPVLPNTAPAPGDNSQRANGNVYIDTGAPLAGHGITASLVLQNTVDQNSNGDMAGRATAADANPEFSGEITASQCGTPITACAPPGTGTNNVVVVSPRNSDGTATGINGAGDRKRFYVVVY
jgi:hypothetical protein